MNSNSIRKLLDSIIHQNQPFVPLTQLVPPSNLLLLNGVQVKTEPDELVKFESRKCAMCGVHGCHVTEQSQPQLLSQYMDIDCLTFLSPLCKDCTAIFARIQELHQQLGKVKKELEHLVVGVKAVLKIVGQPKQSGTAKHVT